MNAVGIDVSKGKSMMAALRPMGEVALKPREYTHDEVGLERLALDILALGEDTRVVMEATGRYHEPVASVLYEYGIRVTVINPLFIKQSGGGSIRKVKTDKAAARKIATRPSHKKCRMERRRSEPKRAESIWALIEDFLW